MAIKIQGLKKEFDGRRILDLSQHEFEKGTFHVLYGENGSGKSTLMQILAGLSTNYEGEVFLFDKNIRALSPKDRLVTMVFQKPLLLKRSVYDNLAYPLRLQRLDETVIKKRIVASMEIFDLRHLWDQDAQTLSLGEAQKLAFLRALSLETPLLLMDEPFSALDQESRQRGLFALKCHGQQKKATILLVSHDRLTIENAKFWHLDKGEIKPWDF